MQSLSAQFSWDAGRVLSTRSGAPWPRSLDTKQPPPPPRMCPTRPGADLSIMWGRGLAANLTCCASGSAAPRTYVMQGGMERMFNKCVTQCRRLRNLNMAGVQGVLVLAGIRGQPLNMEFPLYRPPPPHTHTHSVVRKYGAWRQHVGSWLGPMCFGFLLGPCKGNHPLRSLQGCFLQAWQRMHGLLYMKGRGCGCGSVHLLL